MLSVFAVPAYTMLPATTPHNVGSIPHWKPLGKTGFSKRYNLGVINWDWNDCCFTDFHWWQWFFWFHSFLPYIYSHVSQLTLNYLWPSKQMCIKFKFSPTQRWHLTFHGTRVDDFTLSCVKQYYTWTSATAACLQAAPHNMMQAVNRPAAQKTLCGTPCLAWQNPHPLFSSPFLSIFSRVLNSNYHWFS